MQVMAIDDQLVLLGLAAENRVIVEHQASSVAVTIEGMGSRQSAESTADNDHVEFASVNNVGRVGNPVTAGHRMRRIDDFVGIAVRSLVVPDSAGTRPVLAELQVEGGWRLGRAEPAWRRHVQ